MTESLDVLRPAIAHRRPKAADKLKTAAGKLTFDGARWHPDVVVRLRGVAFTFQKFPYRVARGTGIVGLKGRTATFNLVAYAGNQPLTVRGEVVDPGPRWTGWARVQGRNMAIDERLTERLIEALPEKNNGRQVVRSLHPRGGRFHFDWQCHRDDAARQKPCQQLDLQLVGGAIRYEKFPYPVGNVRGTVRWHDSRWELIHLGSLEYGAQDDPDQDAAVNLDEYQAGSDPSEADTNGDGLSDGAALAWGLDPTAAPPLLAAG